MRGKSVLGDVGRFERFVSPEPMSGCWLWMANQHPRGYGLFWLNGRMGWAHRAAYELHVGPIPKGAELDHKCRVHECVNPRHLEPVTHAENMRRSHPNNSAKTHCAHGHLFDENNTYVIERTRGGRTSTERHCRECHRASRRKVQ